MVRVPVMVALVATGVQQEAPVLAFILPAALDLLAVAAQALLSLATETSLT